MNENTLDNNSVANNFSLLLIACESIRLCCATSMFENQILHALLLQKQFCWHVILPVSTPGHLFPRICDFCSVHRNLQSLILLSQRVPLRALAPRFKNIVRLFFCITDHFYAHSRHSPLSPSNADMLLHSFVWSPIGNGLYFFYGVFIENPIDPISIEEWGLDASECNIQ